MNIQRLNSGKEGKLSLDKNKDYLVVEVTPTVKIDEQPVASFATVTRQLLIIEEVLPIQPISEAKPQGE